VSEESKFSTGKWTATINALLANAENTALPEQTRQAYAAKAAVLMSMHGITPEQLSAAQVNGAPEQAEGADLWPYAVPTTHGLGPGRARAAELIAQAMGCKTAVQENHPPSPAIVAIAGALADLDALRTLLPLVMRQAELAAASAAASGNRAPAYLAGFVRGYGAAVAERITARRREMVTETPGAEVILASRAQAVEKLYQQCLGAHLTNRRDAADNAAGRAAGRAAGSRADLGDTRLNTTTGRAAIGD